MIRKLILRVMNVEIESKDYILKGDLRETFKKIKEEEASRMEEIYEKRLSDQKQEMETESFIEREELMSEISRLNKLIESREKIVKSAQKKYFEVLRRSKTNMRVAEEMKTQSVKLMEVAGTINGTIDDIENEARSVVVAFDKKEIEDKKSLGLGG